MTAPADDVRAWIAGDVDPADRAELTALLARAEDGAPAARDELADRFAGPLAFGTAGLRGPLRAGPNGMNRAVVRRAAAGLAAYLSEAGDGAESAGGGIVVVGYDARHRSDDFARDSAAVLTAAGFQVRLLPRPLPTPVLAFAVQHLGAVAGVMVTASHNPPGDNGYKVYAGDGAQIVPPMDAGIEARIRAAGPAGQIATDDGYQVLDDTVVADYVSAIAALVEPGTPRDISIVHTALHGVGAQTVRAVFTAAGFPPPHEVPEQAEPDPSFPTVAFPNPEEPGAMDLALELAVSSGADLVLANDPDADRCAVAALTDDGRRRMLTGDEVGVLLADWLLARGLRGTYATTIVSSSLLSAMAERHGVGFAETLTGFKWISRAADDLVYGYEEALGYAVAPALVRDKDGISAALLVAEMAAAYRARGSSLTGRLAELAAEYGQHATRQLSWRVADVALIAGAMARVRAAPPTTLLGQPVTVTDLAPTADVLIARFDGGRVVIRPSGTEPKCKAYLEVVAADGDPGAALDRLAQQVAEAVGL